ncbi:hypothetical protein, partial [Nocardia sp. JMUB6875]|uniref:hypothetical protein n=1 Tax=Nocardia sp. JMUB6875 TaxID=3158170 RepID=UPI0034E8E581
GAAWALLWAFTHEGPEEWDGEVPFVVECSNSAPCVLTSLADQTPSLAVRGMPSRTVSVNIPSDIAGLQAGDRVMCGVHVEIQAWGQSANDPQPITTLKACRRS